MARAAASEDLLREAAPRVLAALLRRFGNFADCEDAVQEALLAAVTQWPAAGRPENPTGWLIQVASRRLTDQIRAETARRGREERLAVRDEPPGTVGADDTLVLMFMCCHPALSPASAMALTLRAVSGLTTAEVASAFLVPEATMAQRISRAKRSVRDSGEPFRMPAAAEVEQRLRAVLRVIYLIFNEGYLASGGRALARGELATEAIRLARIVRLARPADPEVAGLLALMLLTDARRAARTDEAGKLVPLDEQDRSLWDRETIAEGTALVSEALGAGAVGEYQLQAAIAAAHAEATSAEATDWRRILGLYELLEQVTGSPVVALNRAIATAMVDGPDAGLALLAELDDRLGDNHRLQAARAHLLEQRGEREAASVAYRHAAALTNSVPERDYLTLKAARLNQSEP